MNLPYILWVAAYNTTFLLAYLILDLVLFPSPLSSTVYDPTSGLKVRARVPSIAAASGSRVRGSAPELLDAINRNGLAFFLIVRRYLLSLRNGKLMRSCCLFRRISPPVR